MGAEPGTGLRHGTLRHWRHCCAKQGEKSTGVMPARVKEAIHSQIQPTPSEQVQLYIVLTLQCVMFGTIKKLRHPVVAPTGVGKNDGSMMHRGGW